MLAYYLGKKERFSSLFTGRRKFTCTTNRVHASLLPIKAANRYEQRHGTVTFEEAQFSQRRRWQDDDDETPSLLQRSGPSKQGHDDDIIFHGRRRVRVEEAASWVHGDVLATRPEDGFETEASVE